MTPQPALPSWWLEQALAGGYVFCITFIWISIGVAIVSLRYGKWIPNR